MRGNSRACARNTHRGVHSLANCGEHGVPKRHAAYDVQLPGMVDVRKTWMGASAQALQSDGGSWCTPKYSGQLKTTAASEYPASSSSGHIHARKANSSATGAYKQRQHTCSAQAWKRRTTTRFRHLAASHGFLLLRPLAQSRQDSRSGAAKSRQQSESDARQACGRPCECSPSRAAMRPGESCGKVSRTGSHATAQTWERKVSAAAHGTREVHTRVTSKQRRRMTVGSSLLSR